MDTVTPLPAPVPDPDLCAALADDLRDAGYHGADVRSAWGHVADDAIGRGLRFPAERALEGREDALAVLARLFTLGMPQPADLVDSALPRTRGDGLIGLGLARREGSGIRPLALVRPQPFADDAGDEAAGGSRATSTRPRSADRCRRTTSSASAGHR